MESFALNPQAEILLSFKRQPSDPKISPRSLAIDLMYVPDEHLIFTSSIPFV